MDGYRVRELLTRYNAKTITQAEKTASGYAWTLDESQPVDDDELARDIDELRYFLRIN